MAALRGHRSDQFASYNGITCDTINVVGSSEKILKRMRENPRDWRIEDLKVLADRFDIAYRQPGGSHVIFVSTSGTLSVPARRPIKPIYIKRFVAMIQGLEKKNA